MHACTAHAFGVELLLWRGDRLRCGVQRLLFAFLFLSSGAQKLSTFNLSNGGPTMEFMAPKMDVAVQHIEKLIGQSLNVPKVPVTCTVRSLHVVMSVPALFSACYVYCTQSARCHVHYGIVVHGMLSA